MGNVNELPSLFNGEMVRAIREGRKTQTRRVVKGVDPRSLHTSKDGRHLFRFGDSGIHFPVCPHGSIGDRLWVRETFSWGGNVRDTDDCLYRADKDYSLEERAGRKWTPSIHMPRWASRIQLEITNIRVERLQDISTNDANSEGIQSWIESFNKTAKYHENGNLQAWPVSAFKRLWDSIYGKDKDKSWNANPWVWVIQFRVVAQ